ncbi:MAG: hypothetical protein IPP74_15470 [Alphaproteobacteria bacterium]|nr:hypothetical protein [Alphaproteobacteria bacterium]
MSDCPMIHLHAQDCEHYKAWIVGTRNALISLSKAISAAMDGISENPKGCSVSVFSADGEGYELIVKCLHEEEIQLQPSPYTRINEMSRLTDKDEENE